MCFFLFLVLTDLVTSMHSLREKHNIKFHCPCTNKQNLLNKLPATNGVSQVLSYLTGLDTVSGFKVILFIVLQQKMGYIFLSRG